MCREIIDTVLDLVVIGLFLCQYVTFLSRKKRAKKVQTILIHTRVEIYKFQNLALCVGISQINAKPISGKLSNVVQSDWPEDWASGYL